MINSKLEKVLIVLVWYVFLITFRLVLPIEEPPGNVDHQFEYLYTYIFSIPLLIYLLIHKYDF